eukprot:g821.t1
MPDPEPTMAASSPPEQEQGPLIPPLEERPVCPPLEERPPGHDSSSVDDVEHAKMKEDLAARGYDLLPHNAEEEADPEDLKGMSKYPDLPPDKCKEKGNAYFNQKRYKKAITYYQGGLKGIMSQLCRGPEALQNETLSDLDLVLNLNTAQCYICLGEPEMGIAFCEKALRRRGHLKHEQLVKALYRKAMCYGEGKTKTKETLEILEDLLSVDPENKAAQAYYAKEKREWAEQRKRDKSKMTKMFTAFEKDNAELKQKQLAEARAKLLGYFGEEFLAEDGGGLDTHFKLVFNSTTVHESDRKENFLGLFPDLRKVLEEDEAKRKTAEAAVVGDEQEAEEKEDKKDSLMSELATMTKKMNALELAHMCHKVKSFDRKQWCYQLVDTCRFALMQYALLRTGTTTSTTGCPGLSPSVGTCAASELEFWFLGASGTFELQFEDGAAWLAAFPRARSIKLVNVGFQGERTPDEEVIPDKQAPEKDGVWATTTVGEATCTIEAYCMPAEKFLPTARNTPNFVFFLQPYLHRYLSSWWETFQVLIEKKYPFAIVGGSEPDYSFAQDEKILNTMGARMLLPATKSPFPMRLDAASKCHHVLIGQGGVGRKGLGGMQAKVELLTNDVHLSLQDGKKCDFECAAAGVVGYFVCAAACVASLKPAEALGCITLGCPPMVAAATEGCLKVNPECVKDEQLFSGRGTKQLEQPATLSSGASTRKAIVQGLVQEGRVAGVLQDKKLLDLDGRTRFAKDIMGGKFDSAANQFLAEALKMQQGGKDTTADTAQKSEMDADPVYV